MELNIDFPRLSDKASPDLVRLKNCLFRLTEQLKYVLSNLDEANFASNVRSAIGGVEVARQDVSELREAIIRTATVIRSAEERIEATLKNEYAAISDIGAYTEEAIASYEVDGRGVEQYFRVISDVAGAVDDLSGYIRTGVLDGGVIGVEIGDLTSDFAPFKVRLTGQRLSFIAGSEEVAYMSDSTLFITQAHVTGKLTLGSYEIDTTDGLAFKYVGA